MPVTDQTPNVIIIDSSENLMEVSGGVAVAAGTKGLLFAGIQSNGSASYLLLDAGGRLTVTGTLTIPNTVTVTGSLKLSETATVTGSITVPNTVTITGSVGVNGQTFVSGSSLAVFISGSNPISVSGTINSSATKVSATFDLGNSSTTPLGSNATFTGTGIDVSGYAVVAVFVYSDTSGTLNLQFSTDNINWDASTFYGVSASLATHVQIGPLAQYFRVVYGNGSVAQTVFRLQTIEKPINTHTPSISVSSMVDPNGDALLTKSVITGKTTAGGSSYVDVKVSPAGSVQVGGAVDQGTGGTSAWLVTGSVAVSQALPSGSNNIGGVGITSDPAEGLTGSAAPRTAMFVAGKDLVSGNLHSLNVRTSGTVPTGADNALVVVVSPNQASIPVPVTGSVSANNLEFGGDGRLRVGQETLLFYDDIEASQVNTNFWTQSINNMSQSQSTGSLSLNSNANTASGSYSILTSNKYMYNLSEFPLYCQFRAKFTPQTNAVIEFGFGISAGTATPTNGYFFRVTSTGSVQGVINYGGTETTTATFSGLSTSVFYNFEVTAFEDHVDFEVGSADGTTLIEVSLPIPSAQGSPANIAHIPVYARIYNSAATTAAAVLTIASVNVQQMDLHMNKSWAEQLAGNTRSTMEDPATFLQTANYTNNTAPVNAVLSNTVASYTTLGGAYRFLVVTGSETDYALFAYQVPTGYQLYVTNIMIDSAWDGAAHPSNECGIQWAVAANSSGVSLATAGTYPPIFRPIGIQGFDKTVNQTNRAIPIVYSLKTPIVVESGRYFHVVMREYLGAVQAGAGIRGTVTIEGYFE